MVSSLEEKLANRLESFPDHGLRVLFLINNTRFIWQQLHPLLLGMERHMSVLARRIEDYIQRYLQVSWAPVVSCLSDLAPLCFGRNYNSCLARFESEFQKTYSAQKLWKVPDPELRRRLRQAVTERVVSGFTEYLEHDNTTPQVFVLQIFLIVFLVRRKSSGIYLKKQEHMNRTDAGSRQKILTALCSRSIYY